MRLESKLEDQERAKMKHKRHQRQQQQQLALKISLCAQLFFLLCRLSSIVTTATATSNSPPPSYPQLEHGKFLLLHLSLSCFLWPKQDYSLQTNACIQMSASIVIPDFRCGPELESSSFQRLLSRSSLISI